jgi:elongator complex protein 5
LFIPATERGEGEKYVLEERKDRRGTECVVEIIVRERGGRKGVERVLEGMKIDEESVVGCSWEELDLLKELVAILRKGKVQTSNQESTSTDPTHALSFNLNLTPAQQEARAQVPLPYAHEDASISAPGSGGHILYDPDSADDLDDEDPDEDLDI